MKKLTVLASALSMLLLAACGNQNEIKLTVVNPSSFDRSQETLEFCQDALKEALQAGEEDQLIVLDAEGRQVPAQVLYNSCHCLRFIFQADVKANDSAVYTVKVGQPEEFPCQAFTTFMPRRKDDISWENDRVIFRMYGPALVTDPDEGMVSGGLDMWVKRTTQMVSQKWYQDEFDGKSSYHHDNGEGLDFYSVGTTLGAGAMAPFADGKLCKVGNNFVKYEILENGPIRTMFRLDYETYDAAGKAVSESRTLTLDAGSYLNKCIIRYEGLSEGDIVAAGFPFRGFAQPAKTRVDKRGLADCSDIKACPDLGFVAYAEPENAENGIIYLGSVLTTPATDQLIADGHVLNCTAYQGKPVVYYSGGAWSKGGFETLDDWTAYVATFATRLQEPLQVKAECSACQGKAHQEEGCSEGHCAK